MTSTPRQDILPPLPRFAVGDRVRVTSHPTESAARVPNYLRGCRGVVERLVDSAVVEDNRGRRRNIQTFQHYRIVVPLSDLWPNYTGSPRDDLHLEICEPWLERLG